MAVENERGWEVCHCHACWGEAYLNNYCTLWACPMLPAYDFTWIINMGHKAVDGWLAES